MPDEMFFSKDERSLIRGSRIAPRTETCRPCVIYLNSQPETEIPGVILDINPHGMLIRLMEPIPMDDHVVVQMMRDEKFQRKLSTPHRGTIRRVDSTVDGFFDHGIKLEPEEIHKADSRPVHIPKRTTKSSTKEPKRMQTMDITLDGAQHKRRR